MSKFLSSNKKRLASSVISGILAVSLLLTFFVLPFAGSTLSDTGLPACQIGGTIGVSYDSAEIMPKAETVSIDSSNVDAMPLRNPHSASGGIVLAAAETGMLANRNLQQTYSVDPFAPAVSSGLGVNLSYEHCPEITAGTKTADSKGRFIYSNGAWDISSFTIKDFLGFSLNDFIAQWKLVDDLLAEYNGGKVLASVDDVYPLYNPVKEFFNSILCVGLGAVVTSNPEVTDVLDVFFPNGYYNAATDVLTNPVSKGTLVVALNVFAGVVDSANKPIDELITKGANNFWPQENGEPYTDPLDFLVKKTSANKELYLTPDTLLRDLVKPLILEEGAYRKRKEPMSYCSVIYVSGTADPEAKFEMTFPADAAQMRDWFLAEFDCELLGETQLEFTERTVQVEYNGEFYDEPEVVVTISGIFAQPGYHSLHMNFMGTTLFVYIDLYVPVTGVSVTPASATLEAGKTLQLSTVVTPADATNKALSFSSDNPAVATVNNSGVTTAVAPGTATVTVTTDDGSFTDTCAVTVTEPTEEPGFFEKLAEFLEDIIRRILSIFGC